MAFSWSLAWGELESSAAQKVTIPGRINKSLNVKAVSLTLERMTERSVGSRN